MRMELTFQVASLMAPPIGLARAPRTPRPWAIGIMARLAREAYHGQWRGCSRAGETAVAWLAGSELVSVRRCRCRRRGAFLHGAIPPRTTRASVARLARWGAAARCQPLPLGPRLPRDLAGGVLSRWAWVAAAGGALAHRPSATS